MLLLRFLFAGRFKDVEIASFNHLMLLFVC